MQWRWMSVVGTIKVKEVLEMSVVGTMKAVGTDWHGADRLVWWG